MKLTFLGVSSALADGYNSNILIDFPTGETLLFDCGMDIKFSLKSANRKVEEIDAVYISHLHADHCAGLEWLGYYSYFISKKKIKLFIHESMFCQLRSMLSPGMDRVEGREASLSDFFDINVIKNISGMFFAFSKNIFRLKERIHVTSSIGTMFSYGLTIDNINRSGMDEAEVFISSDSKEVSIEDCMWLFHDCDFYNLHGVHADYNVLIRLPENIKRKIWLYHHHNQFDKMPDVKADGFAGVVKQGQIFEI